MRTLNSEFPDWDGDEDDLIVLVPLLFDPWHNDECPKYVWSDHERHPGVSMTLWVQYKDYSPRSQRYTFVVRDGGKIVYVRCARDLAELQKDATWHYCMLTRRDLDRERMREDGQPTPLGQLLLTLGLELVERAK